MTVLRLPWQAESLQASLREQWPDLLVQAMAEVGSTNTELLDRARAGSIQPTVLVAEHQTDGRGRQGRQWWATPGDSLTFSIGLPLHPREGWGPLSLVVGHAVAQVLQPWPVDDSAAGSAPGGATGPGIGSGRLMLKWPNDLWWYDAPPETNAQRAAGAKVGGILIETTPLPSGLQAGAAHARWVVIGIGVNVCTPAVPPEPKAPARGEPGAIQEGPVVAGTERWRPGVDAPTLWRDLVPAVLAAVREFEHGGWRTQREAIAARNLLQGHEVSLSAGVVTAGRCVGLDDDGALLVDDGRQVHRIVAGEARIRPLANQHPKGSHVTGSGESISKGLHP